MTPLLLGVVAGLLGAQEPTPKPAAPGAAQADHLRGAARLKASQLIGCAITNTKNEDLGEVQDIVLDGRNHRIAYAVIAFGGFLGMGEKNFAMPWRLLEVDMRGSDDKPRATLGLDQTTLKAAPGFDKSKWPDMGNPTWAKQVDDYYRARGEKSRPEGATEPKGSGVDGEKGSDSAPGSAAFVNRRLTQLIGLDVVDAKYKKIAVVEDLVVDARFATIDGALLSFAGTHGSGEKLSLVPADALKLDHELNVFVLPCSVEHLETLALVGGKVPALNNEEWLVRGRGVCAKAKTDHGFTNGDSIPVDANAFKSAMPADVYDAAKVETIKGTVVTVGAVRIGQAREERVRLRVLLADGRIVTVHGAPASFEAQQALWLHRGKAVEVTGSAVTISSQPVLVAATIVADGKTAKVRDSKGAPVWTNQ